MRTSPTQQENLMQANQRIYRLAFSTPEPVTPDKIWEVAKEYFTSYTLYNAQGVWQGEIEHSYILEVLGERAELLTVQALAVHLRDYFEQTAVLVSAQEIEWEMI
jgi:hypothetical protein